MNVSQPRLYRSPDRMIAGVAGGVADYFDVDPSLVRIVWAISIPFSGFITLLIYIVMAVVVPDSPEYWSDYGRPVPPVPPSPAAGSASGAPDADATAQATAADATTGGWTSTGEQPRAAGGDWRSARRAEREARRQARWERQGDRWERRGDGTGALVVGLLLVIVGGAFLADQLVPSFDASLVWPIALIAIGVVFLVLSVAGRDRRP
ncbi:MAG TPA: PspC domain-containing protein [Candidatus Limnocylindrales bacterium]